MSTPRTNNRNAVAVIGAGPAGMLVAGMTGEKCPGREVVLFEKNRQVGRKLAITGKGRCNVTNDAPPDVILQNVATNPRFLYSAVYAFPPEKVKAFFEERGVPLVTERGRRVFPASGRSYDIVDCLASYARSHARLFSSAPVTSVSKRSDGLFGIMAGDREYTFGTVILATGGMSYPQTGSTGDGYRFASSLGHTIIQPKPSIIPVEAADRSLCASMMGLSLRNVALRITDPAGKEHFSGFGEMLFTHFGISGPLTLSASAHIKDLDVSSLTACIDLKPALDEKTLDARLQRELSEGSAKNMSNVLATLLPSKMITPFALTAGVDPAKKAGDVTREERRRILDTMKAFPVRLSRFKPHEEAVVTSGGVSTKEIDPRTMQSRICENLYFAGEIIDCDAFTGGYNLQIAFSTAAAAAAAVSENTAYHAGKESNMAKKTFKIAIDGPSGAGKSSLAKLVAEKIGAIYVDTGALYRTIGLAVIRMHIHHSDTASVINALQGISVTMARVDGEQHVYLNGEDVTGLIRTPEVSEYASACSAIPEVRKHLFSLQRGIAENSDVIMDGRDIGTVILPDADLKIFLTASPEARAKRRYLELKAKGQDVSLEELIAMQKERDERDSTRAAAPLTAAADAVTIDNSGIDLQETAEEVLKLVKAKKRRRNCR